MTIHSSFFIFFIAIFWLCYECTNGSGTDKVPKKLGESSPNSGKKVINSSEKSNMEKQNKDDETEIGKTQTSVSDIKKGKQLINDSEGKLQEETKIEIGKTLFNIGGAGHNDNKIFGKKKSQQQSAIKPRKGKKVNNVSDLLLWREIQRQPSNVWALLNFEQNYWDANACHTDLEIIGDKNLIVHFKKRNYGWRFVFAKHPFLLGIGSSDIFYFEISIKNGGCPICFGFGVNRQPKSDERMYDGEGFYTYDSQGIFWINGSYKGMFERNAYGVNDIVGCGVNLATRKIFFTKNGHRMGTFDFDPSSDVYQMFPFVSLSYWNLKIEANFGPF